MEKLPMCRVCLADNVRMFVVVNKNLHELYDKLTNNPFVTDDSRPMLACFICCTKLKQCWQLQKKCLEAEELFAQMMNEDYEPDHLMNEDKFLKKFIQTPMVHISIDDACQTESDNIKEEVPAVCERLGEIIEPKEEIQSDEEELENVGNRYSDIQDVPTHHSESKDDMGLIGFATKVEEKQEALGKKRSASDTKQAPVENIPNLHIRRTKQEDARRTEKQTEQSDTHVTAVIPQHTDEKPFKCELCHFSFNDKDSLHYHNLRMHIGEKPFKCEVCQSSFIEKSSLIRHSRIHTGEKPYKCEICLHGFNQKFSLTQHIRKHTGEKPFKCEVCQSSFYDKNSLKRHIRIHPGATIPK